MLASNTSKRVDAHEKRIGLLEGLFTAFESVIQKMNDFSQRMRGHDEDLASHEERITRLERSAGSQSRGIFLVWLVTVLVIEATVFLGWLNMAGLKNGNGKKLGDMSGYDTVFIWAAAAAFVVITLVALVIRAGEPKPQGSAPPRQVPKKIREAEKVSPETERVEA